MPPRRPPRPHPRGPASWWRPLAFVLVLAAAAGVALAVDLPTGAELRATVGAAGWAAPVVFAGIYALLTLAPVPKNVVTAAAGVLFGVVGGVLVVVLAALAGAVLAFGLGRVLGRGTVERLASGRLARADALLARRGLVTVLALRLVPLVPFTAVNYAAGLTGVRLRDYVVGTALGIVPGTVAFVTLGRYGATPASWPFVAAAAVLVVLSVAGVVAARRHGGSGRADAAAARQADRPVVEG